MSEIAAVVVTYNRKEMLRECVRRLRNQKACSCDVIVIDNGSTDGTGEEIGRMQDERLLYLNTGKNLGGAGGFSFGLKKAVELGYEYVWLMDDDTYADENALASLMEADRKLKGNYGFLSGIAYWKDGQLCSMNRQYTSLRGKPEDYSRDLIPVIMATFVSFFVRASVVRKVGLPIADFFIWADDLEYSRRISRLYPCYAVSKSMAVHMMATNEKVGIETDSESRLWRYKYLYRNEVYVYRREGIKGICYLFARCLLHSGRVLFTAGKGKMKKLMIIQRSFWSGWFFHPKVERLDEK